MLGVIIDYISDGDYYKIKTEDGIYLAYQKKSKDIFCLGDTVYFNKKFIFIDNKIIKTAVNVEKY